MPLAAAYNPDKPFNEQVRKLIEKTHYKSDFVEVEPSGKRYALKRNHGSDFWLRNDHEQEGTDGIGTKALLYWRMANELGNNNYVAGGAQDTFAMTGDDVIED